MKNAKQKGKGLICLCLFPFPHFFVSILLFSFVFAAIMPFYLLWSLLSFCSFCNITREKNNNLNRTCFIPGDECSSLNLDLKARNG